MAAKKKYTVLKALSRRNENMKFYDIDSVVELTDEEAKPLLQHGFVKAKKAAPRKKQS